MLECIKNGNGYSLVCEYFIVNKHGQHKKDGNYLYIHDLQGHGYSNIKLLIKSFLKKYPQINYMYSERGIHNKTLFHSRRSYERFVKEV